MEQQAMPEAGDDLYLLILSTDGVLDFLEEFTRFTVERLSPPHTRLLCGLTLIRPRRPVTVAADGDRTRQLDEIQYAHADGPCLEACRTSSKVLVARVSTERRWPEYMATVADDGVRSILAVPFDLDGAGQAALNLYAEAAGVFTPEVIAIVEAFVERTSGALKLAVQVAKHAETNLDLQAAMGSRTTIDLAAGILMGQNRCSQEDAIALLRRASSSRNMKMHDIAAAVVAGITPTAPTTHFDH
ncbi:GAF and ANTAR domain-containing protein [uncultured Arthrobacter sp.]|uniref:GAF and ANTAR domain-containing protein n=1 Tax=uncultured Arthrobacter sp. TaxID=114050 RepID=UPI0025F752E9|nr:GAF and ANTAR domain-containing protein [uncultured Arthrobacter sp.]